MIIRTIAAIALTLLPGYCFAQDAQVPPAQQQTPPQKTVAAPPGPPADPHRQCVKKGEFRDELRSMIRPLGGKLVLPSHFLPTNQRVDIGVEVPFVDNTRYFAGIDYGDETYLLKRQDVVVRRASDLDPLVQRHLLEPGQTIVTVNMDNDLAWFWSKVDLYLYTCDINVGLSPLQVSVASVRLSPYWLSLALAVAAAVIFYVWIALVLRERRAIPSLLSALNPAKVSVGTDGKASLSTFQVLIFFLAVVGLILFYVLQTGMLVELSKTILGLLGITGVASTIAKGVDAQRNAISAENRAWLLRKGWISASKAPVDASKASWSDFFVTDGAFDVFRYQSFVFTLIVTGALIFAGANNLSSFVVPDTILGIVGLSQFVYIGGKFAVPTSIADLNASILDLRDNERKLRGLLPSTARAPGQTLQSSIGIVGQANYDAYIEKAKDVAAVFTAQFGYPVSAEALEPSL